MVPMPGRFANIRLVIAATDATSRREFFTHSVSRDSLRTADSWQQDTTKAQVWMRKDYAREVGGEIENCKIGKLEN
jgi:hypothetical protein